MKRTTFLLLALALLAGASFRSGHKVKWLQHLSGSQKIFGVVAFVLTLLILLNPELLAMGFLADTAFFDMLVLALTLQMHTYVLRAGRWSMTALNRSLRWMGIPSPGLRYQMAIFTVAIGTAVSTMQKIVHRLLS